MKTKRKNIKKKKLDVWLKCGEIEKYLKAKKKVVNTTFYAPKKKFNLCTGFDCTIINCKFIILGCCAIRNYSFSARYRNVKFLYEVLNYGYDYGSLIQYKDRRKFKNKGLK